MMVKMVDSVDSERNQANDRFRGSLEANLMAGDVVVAPKGTTVFGRLLTADSAGRSGGQLEFDLTDIVINGQTYSLSTTSNQAQGGTSSGGTGTVLEPELPLAHFPAASEEPFAAPGPARLSAQQREEVPVERG